MAETAGQHHTGLGGGGIPVEIMARIPTVYLPEIFRHAINGTITIETETPKLKDIERTWTGRQTENKRKVVLI